MERLVKELKQQVIFKDTTEVGDLVLLAAEEEQLLIYALVTGIEPDRSRRDEWWKLAMQVLYVPPQPVIWTLRWEQFTGQEIFTMGGDKRFIQAIQLDMPQQLPPAKPPSKNKSGLRLVK